MTLDSVSGMQDISKCVFSYYHEQLLLSLPLLPEEQLALGGAAPSEASAAHDEAWPNHLIFHCSRALL